MKKLIAIVFLLAGVYSASSQANLHPGFKAGVNLSTWTAQAEGIGISTGFYAGAMVRVPVSKSFSLLPEILFSSEGSKAVGGKYVDHFVKVPLMAQYNHSSGFHFETGPQIGILLSSDFKMDNGEKSDSEDFHQPLEISWGTGFGYTLPAGIGINLRYNKGLTRVGTADIEIKSNVVAAGVHYMF